MAIFGQKWTFWSFLAGFWTKTRIARGSNSQNPAKNGSKMSHFWPKMTFWPKYHFWGTFRRWGPTLKVVKKDHFWTFTSQVFGPKIAKNDHFWKMVIFGNFWVKNLWGKGPKMAFFRHFLTDFFVIFGGVKNGEPFLEGFWPQNDNNAHFLAKKCSTFGQKSVQRTFFGQKLCTFWPKSVRCCHFGVKTPPKRVTVWALLEASGGWKALSAHFLPWGQKVAGKVINFDP